MTAEELDLAVEAATLLGAEQECWSALSGYTHQFPDWLHREVSETLPEHLGFGYVEGVLVQRGWYSTGGYRLAKEGDRKTPHAFLPADFEGGLRNIFPTVLRARLRRMLSGVL